MQYIRRIFHVHINNIIYKVSFVHNILFKIKYILCGKINASIILLKYINKLNINKILILNPKPYLTQ